MNKNPKRPKDMDEIMSKVFNPNFKSEKEMALMKTKKIIQELTEMGVFR